MKNGPICPCILVPASAESLGRRRVMNQVPWKIVGCSACVSKEYAAVLLGCSTPGKAHPKEKWRLESVGRRPTRSVSGHEEDQAHATCAFLSGGNNLKAMVMKQMWNPMEKRETCCWFQCLFSFHDIFDCLVILSKVMHPSSSFQFWSNVFQYSCFQKSSISPRCLQSIRGPFILQIKAKRAPIWFPRRWGYCGCCIRH